MSPAEIKDYYKILGVDEKASKEEINKAFRKQAVKFHPDKTKGNKKFEERFKEINEAHQILSDEEKRKQYDFMRANPYGASGFDPNIFTGGGGQNVHFNMDDLGDLFGGMGGLGDMFDLFGAGSSRSARSKKRRPARGRDTQTSAVIPFLTAAQGGDYTITLLKEENCERCGGSGAEPGTSASACPRCKGAGTINVSQGAFGVSRPCPECMGSGSKITKPCRDCRGRGKRETPRTITVKIPAGIKDGQKIRLTGEGEPGQSGGPKGDLYIQINVEKHGEFTRDGDIIQSEAWIDLPTAILGGQTSVNTLQGPVTLKIPAGTQSGTKFKLKGRGIRFSKDRFGDHYVAVKVRIPKNLTPEQRRLFETFARSLQ